MKTSLNLFFAVATSFVTLASIGAAADDALITFSTKGPDCYADGSVVLDDELYALVWSKDGVFEGLTADGKPIDSNDEVVLVGPLAVNGRCEDALFQVDAKTAERLSRGKYSVLLLDTRVKTTSEKGEVVAPSGRKEDGSIKVLNGYGEVASRVKLDRRTRLLVTDNASANGTRTAKIARSPKDVKQPKILSMRMDDEFVYLTVENLDGFMRVEGMETLSSPSEPTPATETDGKSDTVILKAPKMGEKSSFYRVIRN